MHSADQPSRSLADCQLMRNRTLTCQLQIAPGLLMLVASHVWSVTDVTRASFATTAVLAALVGATAARSLLRIGKAELHAWHDLANRSRCQRTLRLAVLSHSALLVESAVVFGFVFSSAGLMGLQAWADSNMPTRIHYFYLGFALAGFAVAGVARWYASVQAGEMRHDPADAVRKPEADCTRFLSAQPCAAGEDRIPQHAIR